MTPIIVLSDGYLANGSEPWLIKKYEDLPNIDVKFTTDPEGDMVPLDLTGPVTDKFFCFSSSVKKLVYGSINFLLTFTYLELSKTRTLECLLSLNGL